MQDMPGSVFHPSSEEMSEWLPFNSPVDFYEEKGTGFYELSGERF